MIMESSKPPTPTAEPFGGEVDTAHLAGLRSLPSDSAARVEIDRLREMLATAEIENSIHANCLRDAAFECSMLHQRLVAIVKCFGGVLCVPKHLFVDTEKEGFIVDHVYDAAPYIRLRLQSSVFGERSSERERTQKRDLLRQQFLSLMHEEGHRLGMLVGADIGSVADRLALLAVPEPTSEAPKGDDHG